MKAIFLCSPYSGDVAVNVLYAERCMMDSIRRGEAPFAPHLLYTRNGILDDSVPDQRQKGAALGIFYLGIIRRLVVYRDLGISRGMNAEINYAEENGIPVVYRSLGEIDSDK